MKKGKHLYSGKSKSIFATDDPRTVILHFRDDLTAFDGKKKATCDNKGIYGNLINAHLMRHLAAAGLPVHHQSILNERESIALRLKMLKVEFVVRNVAAGSICNRLGIAKGTKLEQPICECFLKDDKLGDPLINESHIAFLKLASPTQVKKGQALSLEVNRHLSALFTEHNIDLVDFKLEFGVAESDHNNPDALCLGDEITPDSCRLWEKTSHRPFDKDIFRFDLGDLGDAYRDLMKRLQIDMMAKSHKSINSAGATNTLNAASVQ